MINITFVFRMFYKRVISCFLLAVFLCQTFANAAVIGSYLLNKEYIAKYLCENKAKPAMKCNGKCHLKKMLQKQEEKQQPFSYPVLKEIKEVNIVSIDSFLPALDRKIIAEINTPLVEFYSRPFLISVFHPPSIAN